MPAKHDETWSDAQGQPGHWIAARIPHQGQMCLLSRVISASPEGLTCAADSHLAPDNPMVLNGCLGAACGIEYAAQAMALHGALMADQRSEQRSRMGFLVSVRSVSLHVSRLDDVEAELTVSVLCEADNGDHCVYGFSLSAAGKPLLDGRALVMLNAPTIST